ncbi:MAG: 2-polyprenyl-3-methyl-5-hydroxy-6-metoxy,4-benzoquinol methylase [Acidimicrobiaceae bacterium]|nr:2-polyprenyl-3-methyl-5-hydroxy-6-metoxy,4-benzoquinol methylase [Acidimicrobiaceae bacterium]
MLAWIARARAALVPPTEQPGAVLVDLACGGGLLAPHLQGKGYRHLGLDLTFSALERAAAHEVVVAQADVGSLPLPDGCADVVCAGEILEHVEDLPGTVAEACRVLRPGGVVVLDTIAATLRARLIVIELAERLPGVAPKGIHDPRLLVDRDLLVRSFAEHGVTLRLSGLRPSVPHLARWLLGGPGPVPMRVVRSTGILFQAVGQKRR